MKDPDDDDELSPTAFDNELLKFHAKTLKELEDQECFEQWYMQVEVNA